MKGILFWGVILAWGFGGCSDKLEDELLRSHPTDVICFSSTLASRPESIISKGTSSYLSIEEMDWPLEMKERSVSKAIPVTSLSGNAGVFGYQYDTWSATVEPIGTMNHQLYSFGTNGELVATDGQRTLWKDITENQLRVYAYVPKDAEGITGWSTEGAPAFTYTVPGDVAKQRDLVVSDAVNVSGNYKQRISLVFNHVLTGIRFKMGFACKVKSLTVGGVYNTGIYSMDGIWKNLSGEGEYTFTFDRDFSVGEMLTEGEQTLMMIPQQLAEKAKVTLVYTEGGVDKTIQTSLEDLKWEKGKLITYTLHKELQTPQRVYFDLAAGDVNITATTCTGWVYVGGNPVEVIGTHDASKEYYVYQSTSQNKQSTGWASAVGTGVCRIPNYEPVMCNGKFWSEFITNNANVESVIEAWDDEVGKVGAVRAVGRDFTMNKIHVVGADGFNCKLTIDNVYSRYQDARAARNSGGITFLPKGSNSVLNLNILGDNRLGSIHYENDFSDNIDNGSRIVFQGTGSLTVASADFQQGKKDVSETVGYISNWWCSAIGADDGGTGGACGIVIKSGVIFAGTTQAENCTALGGGGNGIGNVVIEGGCVTAVSTTTGAAIGGGIGFHSQGGKGYVEIKGGNVYAYNHCNEWFIPCAAIGGGSSYESTGAEGKVIISGGYIYAESVLGTAIGGGSSQSKRGGNAVVTISGGHVIAKSMASGSFSAGTGIGGGTGCSDVQYKNNDIDQNGGNATIAISGNPVIRTGSIGGGKSGNPDAYIGFATISMEGGDVQAQFVMAAGAAQKPTFTMSGGTIRNSNVNDKEYIHIKEQGGAVYMEYGEFTMEGGVVQNCVAQEGGAVYIAGESDVKFEMIGGRIEGCTSETHGGAIYLRGGDVLIKGGILQDNLAQNGNGGAVCIYDGSFSISSATIQNNTALCSQWDNGGGNGGAIYVTTSAMSVEDIDVTVVSGTITQNTCDNHGGGICVDMGNSNSLKANVQLGGTEGGPDLSKNRALQSGGGLYVIGTNAIITIDGGKIDGNFVSSYVPNEDVTNERGTVTLNEGEVSHIVVTFHANANANYPAKLNGIPVESMLQRIVTATNSLLVTPEFTRDNYDFIGWNSRPDGRGTAYKAGDIINLKENLNLYAQWKAQ